MRSGSGIMSYNSINASYQHVTAKFELISQLSCRGADDDFVAILMSETIYLISFGRTRIRHFLLTWVQNGPVGFEKT